VHSWQLSVGPGGAQHFIGAHVADGDQPAPAAEAVVPALPLRSGQIAARTTARWCPRRNHLPAVAELLNVTRATMGTRQQEGHSAHPAARPCTMRESKDSIVEVRSAAMERSALPARLASE